jgi:hypothetical protein
MNPVKDTLARYISYFDLWTKISNTEARRLIVYMRDPFWNPMSEIRAWGQQSDHRLQELRNAMQHT